MAGPGFDYRVKQPDHKAAAKNIQCIHTSYDKGTRYSNCHQNWKMGNCGHTQVAAGPPPLGSHGLCPHFYNSAFEHKFYSIQKPNECFSYRPAPFIPEGFRMGYLETRKSEVLGDIFAVTTKDFPYNFDINSLKIGEFGDYTFNDTTNEASWYDEQTLDNEALYL